MRRPANVFFLAILIGLLSAAMVYRHLRAQQAELEAVRNSVRGAVSDVVVAAEPIPIGTLIAAHQLKVVRWPSEVRPDGALADPAAVVGQVARHSIPRHQPVTSAQLVGEGAGLLPLLIEQGMRGMSVKVDKVTGVSGFVTPNSRVDVLVSGKLDGNGNEAQRSKLILQNIRVLAIGTSIEMQDEKPVEVPTVTLLVSPQQAERLTLAARQEPVRLALRNFRDEEEVTTPGTSVGQLFAPDGGNQPRTNGRPRPPAPRRPSVEVLLGETRTQQVF